MRKTVLAVLGTVSALLLGATVVLYQRYQASSAAFTSMKAEELKTWTRYGDAINSIAAIQDSLNAIVPGASGPQSGSNGYEAERKLSENRGDQVLDRIALLKAGIGRSKERIRRLDADLKKSGIKANGLQKMIANLKQTVTEKEELIAQLSGQVDSLQTTVTGLAAHVEEQDHTIESKRRELGTIYYVIGTKKELTRSGIVVSKGGLLGVGKTLKPSGQFKEDQFTALDTDQETVLRIPATKAQVVSAQPVSSYQLELAGNQLELHITDPKEFRMIKHLVIITT